jgi:hypothetical protein
MNKETLLRRSAASIRNGLFAILDWLRARSPPLEPKRNPNHSFVVRKPDDWAKRSFSQKIAWRCRNPDPKIDYAVWVDKHQVKKLVGGTFDVADTYLVVHDPADIDTKCLPDTFVMKATHGYNMSLLVENGIVKGGNRTTEGSWRLCESRYLQRVAQGWLNSHGERQRRRRERHYQQVRPGILFEQSLDPVDYELQLFLFDGQCRFAMVIYRGFHHKQVSHRLYDENWQPLEPGSDDAASSYERTREDIAQPPIELLENLRGLCQSIDHVRADFLVCGGRYFFSEFTFTHNAGAGPGMIGRYDPDLGLFWSH